MAAKSDKAVRCAIYTRKSTDHGLEQEFNSLDAQREACAAYIKSQASEGWRMSANRYDDPAYSGGDMHRPALRRLIKDIDAGQIDVVVVYKIDRLTRSLADFAKLVEIFDAKSVSFVAVTQQFNTTTSMGRLTLNVLLSFAQFERELASERVRDKVAAARKKGKWTGGSVPLGYDTKDKRLVINATEAKIVRTIFARYLVLKSFQKLIDELDAKGIVTKTRPVKDRIAGGVPFTYGTLSYLLQNRTYLGQTSHDNNWYDGEHEAIVDRGTFDRVQSLLTTNSQGRRGRRHRNGALLTGLIFDDRDNRMSPSFSVKNGVRYPFYVSSVLLRGRKDNAGSVKRVSAPTIEAAIIQAVLQKSGKSNDQPSTAPADIINGYVDRVVVSAQSIQVQLKGVKTARGATISFPLSSVNGRIAAIAAVKANGNAIADAPRSEITQLLVRAHIWLRDLSEGRFDSIEAIAASVRLDPKVIRKGIRMAFLPPDTTADILMGKPPRILQTDLQNVMPLKWSELRSRF